MAEAVSKGIFLQAPGQKEAAGQQQSPSAEYQEDSKELLADLPTASQPCPGDP